MYNESCFLFHRMTSYRYAEYTYILSQGLAVET